MPYRDGDEVETFRNVVVVDNRPAEKQQVSVKCRFADGVERFVSRQWVPSYQEFPDDGSKFELEVSSFMVGLWAKNDSEPKQSVKIADVVCLRESRETIEVPNPPKGTVTRPKALQVRLPTGEEAWCPGKGILPDSPVRADGDRGELWLEPWCAKMKNWGTGVQAAANGAPARSQDAQRDARGDASRGDSIADRIRDGHADDNLDAMDDPLPF